MFETLENASFPRGSVEAVKKKTCFLYVDVGDEKPTQFFGGIIFIRHEIRIPMRQPEY